MGNCHIRKLNFSSRKLLLLVKKMPFNVQCTTFITIRNDKKIVFCFGQDFLAFGPFLGFFWPSEGLRPPSGQKNPKNGPQAKKPGCSTKIFFVLPHVDIVLHFNVEIYQYEHFATLYYFFGTKWGSLLWVWKKVFQCFYGKGMKTCHQLITC